MLHTILVILKIAGIIIAAILGIILLILLGILFIPVRYSSKGEFNEQRKIVLSVSWLLHILHFRMLYDDNKLTYTFRIFGINFFRKNKKKKADKPEKNRKKKTEINTEQTKKESEQQVEEQSEQHEKKHIENSNEKCSDEKETVFEKIKKFFEIIRQKIKAVFEKIKKTLQKIKKTFEKIQAAAQFMQDETTKTAISYIKENVIRHLKHYLPKKVSVSLKFGCESPDITGKILGYLSVIYAMLGKRAKNINVIPDFDNKVLEGNYELRGRIRICHLLILAVKLFLKKEVRISYKRLKKEK